VHTAHHASRSRSAVANSAESALEAETETESALGVDVDADVATALSSSQQLAVWNSVAGQVVRVENREVWDEISKKLQAAALAPLTEWFHKKKCELCQRVMKNLIDKGCTWGVQKICEWSAGTACSASGVPFASSLCAKVCAFGFEVILKEKCDDWLKLLMEKYPGNPLNFCRSKQFCLATDEGLPCKCCDSDYCKSKKFC